MTDTTQIVDKLESLDNALDMVNHQLADISLAANNLDEMLELLKEIERHLRNMT